MAKTDYQSIDAYIAAQPEALQEILQQVRAAIRRALPDAEEAISYQIPAFRQAGRVVIFFAGWKNHYSVYPATAAVVEGLGPRLSGYELGKGTIRFPLAGAVPVELIEAIAQLRASEVAALGSRKAQARTTALGGTNRAAAKGKPRGRRL